MHDENSGKEKKGEEVIFKEIMAENFQNVKKDINLQSQAAQ